MTRHAPLPGRDPAGEPSEAAPDGADPEQSSAASPGASAPDAASAAAAAPEQQAAELHDKWLRARAELENVRRAARLDVDQARRYGAAPTLLALLGVLDNLQRALAHPPAALDEEFLRGLQLIEQQFRDTLASHGVTEVPAARGAAFDPNVHRALLEQPSDEVPAGAILQVVAPGYRLHDRLLREAHVVVAGAARHRD